MNKGKVILNRIFEELADEKLNIAVDSILREREAHFKKNKNCEVDTVEELESLFTALLNHLERGFYKVSFDYPFDLERTREFIDKNISEGYMGTLKKCHDDNTQIYKTLQKISTKYIEQKKDHYMLMKTIELLTNDFSINQAVAIELKSMLLPYLPKNTIPKATDLHGIKLAKSIVFYMNNINSIRKSLELNA